MKRILSLALCILLVLTAFPLTAFASEKPTDLTIPGFTKYYTAGEFDMGNNIKMLVVQYGHESYGGGFTGYSGNRIFYVYGSGETYNYGTEYNESRPTGYCIKIIVYDDITRLGNNVFREAYISEGIELPDSLQSIGDGALAQCTGLTDLTIPKNVTDIGTDAFADSEFKNIVLTGNHLNSANDWGLRNGTITITLPFSVGDKNITSYDDAAEVFNKNGNVVHIKNSNYTATWKNYDGSVIEVDENVAEGAIPTYDGNTPIRPEDDEYDYIFSGWSPEPFEMCGEVTYTATYTSRYWPTVSYIDENGEEKSVRAMKLTGNETLLDEGWYYVGDSLTYDHSLFILGDVHLILADGKTLNFAQNCEFRFPQSPSEIGLSEFDDATRQKQNNTNLYIYSQKKSTGSLNSSMTVRAAAINIYGGKVEAALTGTSLNIYSGSHASNSFSFQNTNIYGGSVEVESVYASKTFNIHGGNFKCSGTLTLGFYSDRCDAYFGYTNLGDSIYIGSTSIPANVKYNSYNTKIHIKDGQRFMNQDDASQIFSGRIDLDYSDYLSCPLIHGITLIPYITNNITYTANEYGTVSGPESAYYGQEVEVETEAEYYIHLSSLTVKDEAGNNISINDKKFTMPASAVTVTANFKKTDYKITYNAAENGKVTGTSTANYDDKVALTATPDKGYELDSLIVKDSEGNEISVTDGKFTMPASAVTVTASFKKTDYTITYHAAENGAVTGDRSAHYGDEITLTVTPDKGYELESLTVTDSDGNEITVTDGKFTMPASNVTVAAEFKKSDYTITYNTPENGTVTGGLSANYGDKITLTVSPDKGYELASLTVTDGNGNEISVTDGKFVMPASNVTVTAGFKIKLFTVKWIVGKDVVETDENVPYGTKPEYNGDTPAGYMISDKGYAFCGWSDSAKTYAADALPAVTANVTYTAAYNECTFVDEEKPYIDDNGEYILGNVAYFAAANGKNYSVNADGTPGDEISGVSLSYFDFAELSDGTYQIRHYTGPYDGLDELVISKTYNGKKITVLGTGSGESDGFMQATGDKKQFVLKLNENITEIKDYAFYATWVTKVYGDTSALSTLGRYAFSWVNNPGDNKLDIQLDYPGALETGFNVFSNLHVTARFKHSTYFRYYRYGEQSLTYIFTDDHPYGDPVWTWADDNSAANAKFTCTDSRCKHQEAFDAQITSELQADKTVYTATVEIDGKTYTDTVEASFSWKTLSDMLANGEKNIVLPTDVIATAGDTHLVINGDVTIDLNGHTIDRNASSSGENNNVIIVNSGTLTIIDSSGNNSGIITGGKGTNGGGINVASGATLNLDGGTITGNSVYTNGGGIYTEGTVIMNGGMISNNAVTEEPDSKAYNYGGGAVAVRGGGSFTMNDGEIKNNSAINGGALYVYTGTITVKGGTVSENTASNGGGAAYVIHGNFYLEDGMIKDNVAKTVGGVYATYFNTATTFGKLHIYGGTITGNRSTNTGTLYSGGVGTYINSNTVDFKGDPQIYGNYNSSGAESNVYVRNNGKFTISGELTEGARIGVTPADIPTSDSPVVMPNNGGSEAVKYFTSDNADYEVRLDSQNRIIIIPKMEACNVVGHSLSLEGDIGVNFYMELSDNLANSDTAKMHFTIPAGNITTEADVKVADAKKVELNGKTYYVFKCQVAAKEMTSEIKAQMIDGEWSSEEFTYSVKEYADYLIAHANENEEWAKAVSLVKAMLNYGAYSQLHFDKNSEHLANVDLTDDEKSLGEINIKIADPVVNDLSDGTTFEGTTLSLKSETILSLYFKSDKTLSFSCDAYTVEKITVGEYQVARITGIKAKHIGDTITLNVNGGTVSYSPLNYCKKVLEDDAQDEKLQNAVKALYMYYEAANAYFTT